MKKMLPLIVLIAAVIFVTLPLFQSGFFVSDDGGWMIIRLSAFFQSFREGQFPVRFLGRLNFGYGYPVANFLYPGYMYIGTLIHILGVSFIDTVKIILGGSVLLGTVCTFLWLKKYFSSIASVIGTLGFTFAPYLLFDLYRRGSVGEILALVWAAMGLYSIAAKKRWLFGLAVPLLILAHNTLALVFLVFFALYITFLRVWRQYFFIFGAGIGMAAFFWLPALYERKYVQFDSVTVANPREYFITAGNAALLGVSGIIAGVASLFTKKLLMKEKLFFLITLTIAIFLVLPASSLFWQIPLFARIIQFPYRLLSVAIFAGAWLIAYVIHGSKKLIQLILLFLFVGIGLWSVTGAIGSVDYMQEPEGFYTTNEATTTVADEYMPRWVKVKPALHAADRLLFYKGRGSIKINTVNSQTIDAVVDAAEESIIQVNTLYYPGWGAMVDGVKVHIDYSNDQDVMRIPVPAGRHHMVVAFRETISRFLADCVSLVSVIVFIVLLFL
jgi:hypothetical protein